jgi:AraC-like DNA-binding protein
MLLSRRIVELPAASAMLSTHAVVHSAYRLHAVERHHVLCDDVLFARGFDRRGAVGRSVATVLLEGRARLRVRGQDTWIEPGEVSVVASKGDILMRQEGPCYRSLVCEWEPGILGERPGEPIAVRRVPPEHLAALDAVARSFRGNEDDLARAERDVTAAWAALRGSGVPLAEPGPEGLGEPVSEATRRLSGALDALQSNLRGVPMMTDLEAALGLSSRQISRVVQEFNERYGFNSSGWRDTRNRWRLLMGATLMTAPGATAEAVSRAVGFASAATFARALANVGLPPPSKIASAMLALR